jgi:F-type H+-transporting ATPase subunit epsilon
MVLKNHAPLISSLGEGRIIYVSDSVEGNIDIAGGFVEIADNKVIVCAEL